MPDFTAERFIDLGVGWNEDFTNTSQYGTITAYVFDLQLFGFDGLLADSV